ERNERPADAAVATGAEVSAQEQQQAFAPQPIRASEPEQRPGTGAARAEAAPASAALPRVQEFPLPVADLKGVAEGSGLQWVSSDADKIAAAQAAMASEPQPAHVPRERPPVPSLEDGPLVLVETKRDLKNLQLPF
ncbi:MAG: ribonuclease, Rne/Rng family, partial [Ramlibacter sp.]|nr:ribonuclease, Rne/Rng family [Ramlibacter sp.]